MPRDVYLPVLDGTEPAKWQPWQPGDVTNFGQVGAKLQGLGINPPTSLKHRPQYRLTLLFHSTETLFKREDQDWLRVVGVVIDASTEERSKIEDNYYRLLDKLSRLKQPWFKDLGFHLIALTVGNTQEQIDFYDDLRKEAGRQLDFPIRGDHVSDQLELMSAVNFYNRGLIGLYLSSDRK